MSQSVIPLQCDRPEASPRPAAAAVYTGPDDVVYDTRLTTADKRAILASWVSDARAVEDAPTLRRLDSGAVVEVAAILAALRSLDPSSCAPRASGEASRPPGGVVVRLPTRLARPKSGEDDDDPPPAPASHGVPFRPIHVAADAGRHRALATVNCRPAWA